MRLSRLIVKNFRSISSLDTKLDQKITAFVGGNESGKSNILKAINKLSDQGLTESFSQEDYHMYGDNSPEVHLVFTLDEDDVWDPELGEKPPKELTISRVGETLTSSLTTNPISINDVLDYVEKPIASEEAPKVTAEEKVEETGVESEVPSSDETPAENVESDSENESETEGTNPNGTPDNAGEVVESSISNVETQSEDSGKSEEVDETRILNKVLLQMPTIVYFPSFDTEELISGIDIPLDNLIETQKKPLSLKSKTILDFLSIGNISIDDLRIASPRERFKRIAKGSAIVGKTITDLWKQEDVKVRIEVSDSKLIICLRDGGNMDEKDDTTWIWACPEDRSTGFRWFLTFYSRFLSGSLDKTSNKLILLDDVGLFLHADAQRDLLQTFERLVKLKNQVMYTTHSPYLLNLDKLNRILLVQKSPNLGTNVSRDWHRKKDYDLPDPLKMIGFTYHRQIFRKKNLVVEGQSDQTLLVDLSKLFSEAGLSSIRLTDISVFPAGGAENTVPFGLLAKSERLKAVILVDHDSAGQQAKDRASGTDLQVITIREAAGGNNKKVTIEDFLPFEKYIQAINISHKIYYGDKWIDLKNSDFPSNPPRVSKIEEKIKENLKDKDLNDPLKKDLAAQTLLDNKEINLTIEDFSTNEKEQLQTIFRIINQAF